MTTDHNNQRTRSRRYGWASSLAWLITAVALFGGAAAVFYAAGDLAQSRVDRMLLLAPWAVGLYWIALGAWRRTRWGRPAPTEMHRSSQLSPLDDRRDAWLSAALLVGLVMAIVALFLLT